MSTSVDIPEGTKFFWICYKCNAVVFSNGITAALLKEDEHHLLGWRVIVCPKNHKFKIYMDSEIREGEEVPLRYLEKVLTENKFL